MEAINGIFKKMALIYKLFVLIALAVVGKIAWLQFIAPTDTTAVDIFCPPLYNGKKQKGD